MVHGPSRSSAGPYSVFGRTRDPHAEHDGVAVQANRAAIDRAPKTDEQRIQAKARTRTMRPGTAALRAPPAAWRRQWRRSGTFPRLRGDHIPIWRGLLRWNFAARFGYLAGQYGEQTDLGYHSLNPRPTGETSAGVIERLGAQGLNGSMFAERHNRLLGFGAAGQHGVQDSAVARDI